MILFNGPILLSDPIIVEFSQCSFLIYIQLIVLTKLHLFLDCDLLSTKCHCLNRVGLGFVFFCVHFTYNKKGTSDITIQKYLCNLYQKWGRKVQRIFLKNNLSRKSNPLLYSKSPICISIIHLHYLNSLNIAIDLSTVCRLTSALQEKDAEIDVNNVNIVTQQK